MNIPATHCFDSRIHRYEFLEIGTLGGLFSTAAAINSNGEVVGTAETADGEFHAFLYRRGGIRDLGTLGGSNSSALDIDDTGAIAGKADLPGDRIQRACVWRDGQATSIGTLGGYSSVAHAIGPDGAIVGASGLHFIHADMHPFFMDAATMRPLLPAAASGVAHAINQRRQITGTFRLPGGRDHGFLYEDGVMTTIRQAEAEEVHALAINSHRQIVGYFRTEEGSARAFRWEGNTLSPLESDSVQSIARSINTRGEIVGMAQSAASGCHACLWRDGCLFDLNQLLGPGTELQLTNATKINDHGEIVGEGIDPQGNRRAWRLSPR